MSALFDFFATAPRGTERMLSEEIRAIGATDVEEAQAGVSFKGKLEIGYRACLWSRVASRILLGLGAFRAETPEALYNGIRALPWEDHLEPDGTLAVDLGSQKSQIRHTHFGALKVKDAVVDRFRDKYSVRPNVDLERPNVRINVYLFRDEAKVSLDLSGESLHRRGYRETGGDAPLKENLAAAILLRARWPEFAAAGAPLLDPMCGSGTLPIEAAWIAGKVAPGLQRRYFGFLGWKQHDPEIWARLLEEARTQREEGLRRMPTIVGYDVDPKAVREAIANVERAGLHGKVHVERRELDDADVSGDVPGLLVMNPPYGERMGLQHELGELYAQVGDKLRASFAGWRAAVFTGNPALAPQIRLKPRRSYELFNGAIPCKLLVYKLASEEKMRERAEEASRPAFEPVVTQSPGGEMLENRLRKNLRHFGKWARRTGVSCYRLYDGDLPEYPLLVDLYQGEETWAHVQAFAAPDFVEERKAEERLREALSVLYKVLEIPEAQVFFKVRRRQSGKDQYEKQGAGGRFYEVTEGDCRFRVNFTDYLDTGLFLDHRITRQKIGEKARGKRFLNLFGYTGTATVHAAMGGAVETTTVDLSRTYLDWARQNMALNGFGEEGHELVRADCLEWLEQEARRGKRQYGLIFLDPPTFSNSKRMDSMFDVQQDHVEVITNTVRLLEPGGILLFSTNRRNFRMEMTGRDDLKMTDITGATIPQDFARHRQVHHCWEIVRVDGDVK
ncbi:MAG: bifunctional 23S rRNA (guanine(2069)-N(7))-methyltransferase RlmK/23S rRNA (guanine(2445)-N(2))-methyltransferase RlmL [bacterium]|nr:bifunctional 23S rRNA (guanine(2069)-N(7))-methyltransferase RlmK/23S rRNA (guanine(2445)-N(2))-methyltransferase RlmL [bacterium]